MEQRKSVVVIVDPEALEIASTPRSASSLDDALNDLSVSARIVKARLDVHAARAAGEQHQRVALVVTSAAPSAIQSARAAFPSTPILALYASTDSDSACRPAVEAGADYILPHDAVCGPLLTAVFLAASRASPETTHVRALEAALDTVSDAVEVSTSDARLLFVNRAFERMTGYDRTEVIGKTPAQLVRSDVHDAQFYGEMWKTIFSGQPWTGSLIGRRKNGSFVAQLATVRPVSDDADGSIRNVVAVKQFVPEGLIDDNSFANITALTNSERRYRTLVEAAGDAIVVIDFQSGRFIEMNPAAVEMFGYEPAELRQLTPRQIAGPEASPVVDRMSKALIENGKAIENRHPFHRKDGSRFLAAVNLTACELLGNRQYVAVIRDVTDQVEQQEKLEQSNQQLAEAQTQLLQSSRLAALGQLAAGIAHEINNPLQYILAGIEEIDLELDNMSVSSGSGEDSKGNEDSGGDSSDKAAERRQIMADMRAGAARIRSITRSLLPFAGVDGSAQMEVVDLDELVEWSTRLLGNELRHRARLELRKLGSSPLPRIVGNRARLTQLVTNLVTNAVTAIEEGASERHSITVTTEQVDDAHVRLTVEDTGRGIPEELHAKIFDPFFTTKPADGVAGGGLGLGLAICAEVVARHGGSIELESKVGTGSRFIVTLRINAEKRTPAPAVARAPAQQTAAKAAAATATATATTQATRPIRVLVIDDEEALMRTYKRSLRGGFDVVTALGGKAALEILTHDLHFDAIVCDLMMPSVDGPMVYAFVQKTSPALTSRILFCSGGAFTARVRAFLEGIPNTVLDKPVGVQQLREALQAVASA